jgi:hypothetical protein
LAGGGEGGGPKPRQIVFAPFGCLSPTSVSGDPPYRPKQEPEEPGKNLFWTVHPKPGACEKCKEMEGIKFKEEPERPHPNCKCEIRKNEAKPEKRYFSGFLSGYEDNAVYQFRGLDTVVVTVTHVTGALASGVHVFSNRDGDRQSHTLGGSVSFEFHAETDVPVFWSIHLIQKGANNTMVRYDVEYGILP